MSRVNSWIYLKTDGRWGARFLRGAPVLLLTTTGKKSGEPRTTPLLYLWHGDDVLVVASSGGMARHPFWYTNLLANPRVTMQIGGQVEPRVAEPLDPAQKAEVWPALVAMYLDFDTYQSWTDRDIPVVRLRPVPTDQGR
jgi:deazaflavin-dependent oxidoreductase (nitroreductase family)